MDLRKSTPANKKDLKRLIAKSSKFPIAQTMTKSQETLEYKLNTQGETTSSKTPII